jgi:cytoskeletal protein CcmA (bactofilin family)
MRRTARVVPVMIATIAGLLAVPAGAAEFHKQAEASFRVAADETQTGDRYAFSGRNIAVDGTLDGDLMAWAPSIHVAGTLDGDGYLFAQSVVVDGTIKDSARVFASSLIVNGTVEGDLLAFAGSVVLGPNARVTGDLLAFAQNATVEGRVDGDLDVTGGTVQITGLVGGDAELTSEEVELAPSARIGGSLSYSARKEIELAGGAVGGEVTWEPVTDDEDSDTDADDGGGGLGSALWWLWKTAAALLVGLLGLAAFRTAGPRMAATVGSDALGSLGVGFVTAVVVPVSALLICVAIVTIPLAFLAILLYLVALYVAKLPVAVWVGQRLLRLGGSRSPSSALGLILGVPILYLVFEIPYLGRLAWLVALFMGLGAILLGIRERRREAAAAPAGAAG